MEDQVNTESVQDYSSSMAGGQKKSANKWLYILIGLLLIGGLGTFMFLRSSGEVEPTPTPSFGVIPVEDGPVTTATPTATPEPVDKSELKVEIQNGTGIPGEAGFLQTKLKALGFTDITAGNASSTDHTDTTVTFGKDVPVAVQDEIKEELEGLYKKVVLKTSSTQTVDILVITGLRSGATPVSKTATPRPSASGTARPLSGGATATPTATPTRTPTPPSGLSN